MNKTIENKLLHFFTSGNIYEDFAAARAEKVAKLRRFIRACFYVHFAAALICVLLAVIFRAGWGILAVAVCEVVIIGLAFMSVGDMTLIKTLLFCGDIAFAAGMFVTGILAANKAPFFAIGGISVLETLVAFAGLFAASCREYLEEYSPLALRREHYTLSSKETGDDDDLDDDEDIPEEPEIVIPPPKTEIQVLADKLKDILCAPPRDDFTEAMPAITHENHENIVSHEESEAPMIPEEPPQTEVS